MNDVPSKIPEDLFNCSVSVLQEITLPDTLRAMVDAASTPVETNLLAILSTLETEIKTVSDKRVALARFAVSLSEWCDDSTQKIRLLEEALRIEKLLKQYRHVYDILGMLIIEYSKAGIHSIAHKYLSERERIKAIHLSRYPFNPRSRPRKGRCKYYRRSDGYCNYVNYTLVCPFNARAGECPLGKSKKRGKKKSTILKFGKEAFRDWAKDRVKQGISIFIVILIILILFIIGLWIDVIEWFSNLFSFP
jgi:hypothetical protein